MITVSAGYVYKADDTYYCYTEWLPYLLDMFIKQTTYIIADDNPSRNRNKTYLINYTIYYNFILVIAC